MRWYAITSTFIHCVSPPKGSHAEPAHRLKPILWDKMSNSCASGSDKKVFLLCHQRFIHEECLLTLERLSESDNEKSKSNFMITSQQQTTNRALLTHLYTYIWIHQIKGWLTSYDISHIHLHNLVLSIKIQSGSVLSIWLSLQGSGFAAAAGIVLTVRQAGRQSSIRTTSSWFLERRGLDLTALSQIKKGDPDWLRKAVRPLLFPHIFVCCRRNSKVTKVVFSWKYITVESPSSIVISVKFNDKETLTFHICNQALNSVLSCRSTTVSSIFALASALSHCLASVRWILA